MSGVCAVVLRRQKRLRASQDASQETGNLQLRLAEIRRRLKDREVECRILSVLLSGSMDASADPTAILDSKGNILATNLAWQRHSGRLTGEHESYAEGCPVPVVKSLLKRVLSGHTRDAFVSHSETIEGSARWYETRIARIEDGTSWLIVIHNDVTASETARHEVMSLTEQLVSMQEEERERIARELHDSTSQHLASVGLLLSRLRHAAPAGDQNGQIIGQINLSLKQAQAELRAFTYLLHPPELDRGGLKSAIEGFVAGFADRTRLRCHCRIDDAADLLPFDAQCSIFRVLQEALANVYRHAGAKSVNISLGVSGGSMKLMVRDDGHGMSKTCAPGNPRRTFGVGIPGMQARMRRLGGTVVVKSTNQGTIVVATAPVQFEVVGGQPAAAPAPAANAPAAKSQRGGRRSEVLH
jgi:signal transduction histidine kinase